MEKTEKKIQSLIDIPVPCTVWTVQAEFVTANQKFLELLGISKIDELKNNLHKYDVDTDLVEVFINSVPKAVEDGISEFNYIHRHVSGHVIEVNVTLVKRNVDDFVFLVAYTKEKSEENYQKQMLEKMKFCEDLDKYNIIAWMFDEDRKRFHNKSFETFTSYTYKELTHDLDNIYKYFLPGDAERFKAFHQEFIDGKRTYGEIEAAYYNGHGEVRYIKDTVVASNFNKSGKKVFTAIATDVTGERNYYKKTEYELNTLRDAVKFCGAFAWTWNGIKNEFKLLSADLENLGLSEDDFVGTFEQIVDNVVHPDDKELLKNDIYRCITEKSSRYVNRFRVQNRRTDEWLWYENYGRLKFNENNECATISGALINIDTSIKNENFLMEINKQDKKTADALFKNSNQVMFMFDDSFNLIDYNGAFLKTLHNHREFNVEDFFSNVSDYVVRNKDNEKEIEPVKAMLAKALVNGSHRSKSTLKVNNKTSVFDIYYVRIPYKSSFAVVCYANDITELNYSIEAYGKIAEIVTKKNDDLQRQANLLKALNEMCLILFSSNEGEWQSMVHEALKIVKVVTDSDRISIWRNEYVDEKLFAKKIASVGGKPGESGVSKFSYGAFNLNLKEEKFISENAKESKNKLLSDYVINTAGIHHYTLVSIFLGGEFWGVFAIMYNTPDHTFSWPEINVLSQMSVNCANAVLISEHSYALVEANKAKSQFLSSMSHEIRTPMNAVIGMTQLARKTNDMYKINSYLEKIFENSHRLMNLINNVLDMSKIESGKLFISENEFDYIKMVEKVINTIQDSATEKKISIKIRYDYKFEKHIWADELRLSQVILNLLSNAVKFTPVDGKIELRTSIITRNVYADDVCEEKYFLLVEVSDTGIGISDEAKPRLFSSFEQADNTITRQYGGTGLGLAICKQIVVLMGGDIEIDSTIGKGSTFHFEIPFEWGSNLRVDSDMEVTLSDVRILIVDDDLPILEYFTEILKTYYIACETADNGKTAIELIGEAVKTEHRYDIAIIDYNMPDSMGDAVAKKVKEISPHTKIIMISAFSWSDIRDYFQSIEVDFMPKPVLPSDIYNKIMQTINYTGAVFLGYNFKGKRILLVEDIEINRLIVTTMLEETKAMIDEAINGEEALKLVKNFNYDLVLMDMQMPVMDGVTATKKIRQWEQENNTPQMPIIAMTANAFKEDVEECLAAGMNAHISKPIDSETFMKTLNSYLNG
ncbi:hypothetical protein FACS1894132_00570 [Clostridia bacterium]|nr:hypothetical protein FACS1894132_00570 [Clostridia bacterium]